MKPDRLKNMADERNAVPSAGEAEQVLALEGCSSFADEAALVALVAERVAELLERQPEYLMSLLYRLDVLEEKIVPVMRGQSAEPIPVALARLIVERQKQRLHTRRTMKPRASDQAEEWRW